MIAASLLFALGFQLGAGDGAPPAEEKANTWVKLSPLPEAPPSPRLGYEGACVYDTARRVLIRYGGHNQGGGGEQNAEVWIFDPGAARWELKLPNTSPPGICCGQQNVFDPVAEIYIRFPAFSGSHGWQWRREILLNDASVWTYDPGKNLWRPRRPLPEPRVHPLRCASWDSHYQVIVLFGGEGSHEGTLVYDPHTNTWTRMRPPEEPPARSGGNMAYDRARRLHILFGAQFEDDPHTWAYDLRQNRWRDMAPPLQPPTDKNDAVLAYDEAHDVIVAVTKQTTGDDDDARHKLETWAYDAGANTWRAMKPEREPDPSGNRARVLMYAPDLGALILENRTHPPRGEHEQQILTYRHPGPGAPPAALPTPATVKVRVLPGAARLEWTPPRGENVKGWAIYRGSGDKPWQVELQRVRVAGQAETSWEDRELESGKVHYYCLRAAGDGGKEGPQSRLVQTRPRAVEDLVVSVLSAREVNLTWSPPPEAESAEILGYVVERAAVEVLSDDQLRPLKARTPPLERVAVAAVSRVGPFQRLNEKPLAATLFRDGVDLEKLAALAGEPTHERRFGEDEIDRAGRPYPLAVHAYRVRAVNLLGVESGPSPAVLTIPAAPEWVFAREEGDACRLKWAERRDASLSGYRVYRLDGRYDKSPVSRLTPEPISGGAFTDREAGSSTRRYYIVAVDALGQEGHPSAPVWHRREWEKYYEPFAGEWHQ